MPKEKNLLAKTKRRQDHTEAQVQAGIEAWNNSLSPLDYMLSIMRDPNATPSRRDRMARDAAPYCHPKMIMAQPGKKDQRMEAAESAGVGTEWATDLEFEDRAN